MQTTFKWEKDWLITYDLDNAEGITKKDIALASKNILQASFNSNGNAYELPSTVLWASRKRLTTVEDVKKLFYNAFNIVKKLEYTTIKRLIICDYANDSLYIENN